MYILVNEEGIDTEIRMEMHVVMAVMVEMLVAVTSEGREMEINMEICKVASF